MDLYHSPQGTGNQFTLTMLPVSFVPLFPSGEAPVSNEVTLPHTVACGVQGTVHTDCATSEFAPLFPSGEAPVSNEVTLPHTVACGIQGTVHTDCATNEFAPLFPSGEAPVSNEVTLPHTVACGVQGTVHTDCATSEFAPLFPSGEAPVSNEVTLPHTVACGVQGTVNTDCATSEFAPLFPSGEAPVSNKVTLPHSVGTPTPRPLPFPNETLGSVCMSRKVGTRGSGWVHPKGATTWLCLGSAVKRPSLALGDPFLSVWYKWTSLRNKPSHLVGLHSSRFPMPGWHFPRALIEHYCRVTV